MPTLDLNAFSSQYMQQVMRQEEDPGMQVWSQGQLIGWLRVNESRVRGGYYDLVLRELPSPLPSAPDFHTPIDARVNIRRISLKVIRRTASISGLDLNMAHDRNALEDTFRRRHNVPSSATMESAVHMDAFVFRWHVLEASVDQAEEIFDLDDFTPNPDHR